MYEIQKDAFRETVQEQKGRFLFYLEYTVINRYYFVLFVSTTAVVSFFAVAKIYP